MVTAMKKRDSESPLAIPFGRVVRVGNYKLWRSKYTIGSGRGKADVDCINVSTIDDSGWLVRIPATKSVYGMIAQAYATTDDSIRENFLGMVFTNYNNLTTIDSEALHDAFFFLTEMMTFPYLLLPEKEMCRRMEESLNAAGMEKKARKEHIDHFRTYRTQLYELIDRKRDRFIEEYERQQAERAVGEDEAQKALEQDDIAEQAMEILTRNESEQ